jgi:hypothetical protein
MLVGVFAEGARHIAGAQGPLLGCHIYTGRQPRCAAAGMWSAQAHYLPLWLRAAPGTMPRLEPCSPPRDEHSCGDLRTVVIPFRVVSGEMEHHRVSFSPYRRDCPVWPIPLRSRCTRGENQERASLCLPCQHSAPSRGLPHDLWGITVLAHASGGAQRETDRAVARRETTG